MYTIPADQSERGVAPILLLLLVIMLVVMGGGAFAVVKLASPECQDKDYASCFLGARRRAAREVREREAQPGPVVNEVTKSGELKRHGRVEVHLDIKGTAPGEGTLHVDYDRQTVEGHLDIVGNILVEMNVDGTVSTESGAISATVSADHTQTVNTGPLQGSVGQQYTGKLTGTLSDLDTGSGNITLTQRVTSVTGNLGTINVGDTQQLSFSWNGEP